MRKYCRICWNTKYWREPTGEARHTESAKSYVQQHGFGHEEWLFNFSWLLPSPSEPSDLFKYGFLQPIGKYRGTYEGEVLDVLLYTITPDRKRLAVAEIRGLLVPKLSELSTAVGLMRRNGWLRDMEDDLSRLGIPPTKLSAPPDHIVNVRFKESEVTFFDPRMRRSTGTARCRPRTSRFLTTSSLFSVRSQRRTRPDCSPRQRTVFPPPRLRTFLAECRLRRGWCRNRTHRLSSNRWPAVVTRQHFSPRLEWRRPAPKVDELLYEGALEVRRNCRPEDHASSGGRPRGRGLAAEGRRDQGGVA